MSDAEVYDSLEIDIQKEISDKLSAAKEWGSYIFSKAMKSSEEAVKRLSDRIDLTEIKSVVSDVTASVKQVPLIREFERAQADFAVESQNKNEEAIRFRSSSQSELPPWHPDICGLSDSDALSSLKEQILALSQNPNNFLISPPEEAQLKWTSPIPDNLLREAQILLKEDPNLGSIRYRLVPSKISEEIFWRNYFYRLSLIQQSASLSVVMDNTHQPSISNNGGITNDNNVSDTDFVCIEQNPIWSKMNTNLKEKEKSKENQKSNNSSMKSKITSDKSLKTSSSKEKSKMNSTNTTKSSPTSILNNSQNNDSSSHISSTKTLEEQLEEEIAREVDELVLTKSENNSIHPNNNNNDDISVTDEIDEELELEILAELEGGDNVINHSTHCNDNVKEVNP
ncbi:synapse-associated protein, putative [Schistosoma mansoni]|uniref:Synapse-associated protein, putative n=1 Tax=Schistosoma mansoni TaxID=6183 RepID=G4M0F8_SCHMA|nr:synapse-associated protein, putative [Schistosoma mansoni]|eukprot:XP_018646975.1 synapse-associated protein, putative [Schistosoma mansoni]